jgi:hypothetical protein
MSDDNVLHVDFHNRENAQTFAEQIRTGIAPHLQTLAEARGYNAARVDEIANIVATAAESMLKPPAFDVPFEFPGSDQPELTEQRAKELAQWVVNKVAAHCAGVFAGCVADLCYPRQ